MNLENLRQQREKILQIATQYGASNLQVFGSVARQDNNLNSDVDFLIELEPQRTLLDQIALSQDLEELLGCRVDIVEAGCLHDVIRSQVLQEVIPL